jgi:hypothetical protein
MKLIFIFLLSIISLSQLYPQNYFYTGKNYGNESLINPVYVFINGGFDMLQVGNRRDLSKLAFATGAKNVYRNLANPFKTINNYGWWNFISDQVLPLSLDKKNAQFLPNYTLHLLGGGLVYAETKEWYELHNYPYAGWLSAFTIMAYHFVNEAIENDRYIGDDVDPIADIYIFDLGSIWLFSYDNVKKFFRDELNFADWSLQPSVSFRNGELHNMGQFFSMKWKLPFSENWHLFYFFGTHAIGGLSYKFENGIAISAGAGAATNQIIELDEVVNKKTVGMVGSLGFFVDKNNSLLASLSIARRTDYTANLNIYPGLINLGSVLPGIWLAYTESKNIICGISVAYIPLGAAYNFR